MNIAYLIVAHHQPSHCARLINALNCDGAYFFVHVDLKADISPFKAGVSALPNVIFLENSKRVKVHWGGYSTVIATLNLLRAASALGVHFSRYCLLSGSDFPIKKNSQIMEALSTNTEFLRVDRKLDYEKDDSHSEGVKYYHCYDNAFLNPRTTPSNRLFSATKMLLRKIPRQQFHKIPLYHGSEWWALTDRCVEHIFSFLEKNQDYAAFHKYTRVPDESFFHSIIKSSPFADCIIHDFEKADSVQRYFESNEHGCHYIDWNSCGIPLPKVLDLSDAERLMASTALFARKFDENKSTDLLNQLEEMIQP